MTGIVQPAAVLLSLSLLASPFGEERVVSVEKKAIRSVYGTVRDPVGKPLPAVLVEVFDNGDALLTEGTLEAKRAKQHKVAELRTNENGKFDFPALPSGRYEIQFSKRGFNVLSVIITVDVRHGKRPKQGLVCVLSVAT